MSYITNKAGITLDGGFKLDSAQPLDVRFVVEEGESKNDLLTSSCYPGMEVWDYNDNKKYRAVPSTTATSGYEWKEVGIVDDIPVYGNATESAAGLMSKDDKKKLNEIETKANNYTLPTASTNIKGGIKVGNNLSITNEVLSANDQAWNQITGKPSTFPPEEHEHGYTAYGTCTTAATTPEKVVVIEDKKWTLRKGGIIGVKFSYTNKAEKVTLNVNESGAKTIVYNTSVYESTSATICGTAGRTVYYMYNGESWVWVNQSITASDTIPSVYINISASTVAKTASCTGFVLTANTYIPVNFRYGNSAAKAFTLNINNTGAKPVYLNGQPTSQDNYNIPAGTYIIFYDGDNYHFRTDGKIPANIYGSAESLTTTNIGSEKQPVFFNDKGLPEAVTHTLESSVPANAKFTDTTYEAVVSGGTAGLMTGTDKQRLDGLWTAWADGDDDKLVNKISEVLAVFQGYEEGKEIVEILVDKAPTSHAAADGTYGLATATLYGHAMASSTMPKANGAAAVGNETSTFARGDHIHPLQTSVSGNAGSADKLNSNAGSATQPIYFVDGKPVATTYELNKTVPADAKFTDTDEKVKTTVRTGTTNYYLAGTAGATTGGLTYDTGIKMGDSNGELIMKRCNVNSSAAPAGMEYDSIRKALVFVVN